MNIDRLTEIAEWLEAGALRRQEVRGFNMERFCDGDAECGTVLCICGAAIAFDAHRSNAKLGELEYANEERGAHILGLNIGTANKLFYPRSIDAWDRITPEHAGRVIRNLIATGQVNWLETEVAA